MCIRDSVQREIGGGVVYLECEEKPELLNFYQNEKNRFRKFGERLDVYKRQLQKCGTANLPKLYGAS